MHYKSNNKMKNIVMEDSIRSTFYNIMFNIVPEYGWIKYDELQQNSAMKKGLIILTVLEVINQSKNLQNKIKLINGNHVDITNCPEQYKQMFMMLLLLKNFLSTINDNNFITLKLTCIEKLGISNNGYGKYIESNVNTGSDKLIELANQVYELELFHTIINKLITLYGSMYTNKISENIIRDSFYNAMVNEALEAKFNKESLEASDPFIFFDLSAFTLIECCRISKNYNGIKLMDGSTLTIDVCPDTYIELVHAVLQIKNNIANMPDKYINRLKKICSTNPDNICPEKYKTEDMVKIATVINSVATKVSQRNTFKNIINNVIQYCLEIL